MTYDLWPNPRAHAHIINKVERLPISPYPPLYSFFLWHVVSSRGFRSSKRVVGQKHVRKYHADALRAAYSVRGRRTRVRANVMSLRQAAPPHCTASCATVWHSQAQAHRTAPRPEARHTHRQRSVLLYASVGPRRRGTRVSARWPVSGAASL